MCLLETAKAMHGQEHGHEHVGEHSHDQKSRAAKFGRRALLGGGAVAAMAAVLPGPAEAQAQTRVADLTHTLTAGFPVFALGSPTKETLVTVPNDGFFVQRWTVHEHAGTHVDAPSHFISGGRTVEQLSASELILPLAIINISSRAATNPDTQVTVADIEQYERNNGRIPTGAAVFMRTGWDAKVAQGAAVYLGQDAQGGFHFPAWSVEAVRWLLDRRGVKSIGVDTAGIDFGQSATFEVHTTLLGANRYGIENLKGLSAVPAKGAKVGVGVIPYQGGSGGQARVLAMW